MVSASLCGRTMYIYRPSARIACAPKIPYIKGNMMNNIVWQTTDLTPSLRTQTIAQNGMVVWFTGLSGSGKSTIASKVELELAKMGFSAYLLDGDNLRHGLCSDLGFSDAERDENIRRVAHTAALMEDAGLIAITSAISPFAKMRDYAKKTARDFCEIYVKASVETCAARDVKGLYKKAIAGEIPSFTGISSPYEVPENPTLTLDTESKFVDECVGEVLDYIMTRQIPHYIRQVLNQSALTALKAGREIMKVYAQDFAVDFKDDKSPLTMADTASDAIIKADLTSAFPRIAYLSEETADDLSRLHRDFCFIIDPLDGTKEFVKKNGEFTVNIGLSYKGKTIAGVVYAPASGILYYGAKALGAWAVNVNEKTLEMYNPADAIRVSERTDALIVMLSRSHQDEQTIALLERNKARIAITTASGSSLKGCLIAEGKADVYYRLGYTMQWDTCAMQAIIEASGGTLTQGDGTQMLYNRENSLNDKGFIILNRPESALS